MMTKILKNLLTIYQYINIMKAQRFVFKYRDDAIPRRGLNDFFHKANS